MTYNYLRLETEDTIHSHPSDSRRLKVFFAVSLFLNLALVWLSIVHPRWGNPNLTSEPHLYSPAEDVVRQKIVKFTRGVADDIPIYERRASAAVDEAWRGLYSVAATKMSRLEAEKMPNKTWPLHTEKGNYIFTLDVFHQLHCLDTLRQQANRGHNYTHVPIAHVRHCVGVIRQALMCSADITPVVWQWSEELQKAEQRDDILHVCRDFDRIRDWASERTFVDNSSGLLHTYIEDDLTIPEF
ncbi:hypothetical protein B0H17DRAFT_994596 [Mycena rosella]|uniref:Cyclochlorotine biosynthesis protein O n=1 Tax=Mycena rosella TaxID=1033263 RepID=A0AAD7FTY5_MYCRO|nr:hypothetical protein B0H17DRAFT_994596 [Mycena rosella]